MKRSDTGEFCVLYLEAADDRTALTTEMSELRKPAVIMLAEQVRLFQRPDDFSTLKHLKRRLDIPVVFVIPHNGHAAQLAARFGFPVYLSMDALANALAAGQFSRQRSQSGMANAQRITAPLSPAASLASLSSLKKNAISSGPLGSISQPLRRPKEPEPVLEMAQGIIETHEELPPRMTPPLSPRDVNPPQRSGNLPARENRKRETRSLRAEPLDESLEEFAEPEPLILERGATRRGNQARHAISDPAMELTRPQQLRPEPVAPPRKPQTGFAKVVAILAIIALSVAGLGYFLVSYHQWPTTTGEQIVGQITYASSNQVSDNNNQGISDQVIVDFQHINPPEEGAALYAWLLGDKQSEARPIALGRLTLNNGKARLFYPGDAKHTNILAFTSRFLITEESSAVTPVAPSPNYSQWRYYGEISQVPLKSPEGGKQYSYLDHLRHLLASDPTLDKLNLPGGLNTWFYRNSGKVLEWTTSTRDLWQQNNNFTSVRSQAMRTLEYLDGATFVSRDLPKGAPLLVNERLAQIGMVQVDGPNQEPPCYFNHVMKHVDGLLQAPGAPGSLRKDATEISNSLNAINGWLNQIRTDAKKLVSMNDKQIRQPSTLNLLNDMIANANYAYTGHTDPATGSNIHGITWIHEHMQSIATFNVSPYQTSPQSTQMIQDLWHTQV
ncbi:hypothetical protein [Ktedonospora formicarum]|uniref:Uncharacterized protein n=1 Tax=Ktedonospora formicarum TaxID=2778364 RepID=A0A8J3HZ58_9CHLR|nr:hypothetical protein [Ktedonospora formicarum]GHO46424.1 hypothetical protein KSX_45870 [Ktedonospora formicarum]